MLALATDVHLDKDNIPEVEKSLEYLFNYLLENSIMHLFLLGDLFTNRVGQGQETLLFWQRFLRRLTKKGIKIYVIPGNHDKSNLESPDSYCSIFEDIPGVQVYPEGGIVFLDGVLFALMPYFKEDGSFIGRMIKLNEEVEKMVKKHKPERVYLGTHIAVDNVKNNDGGLVHNSIKASMFKLYDRVFIGHYHNEQEIDNIWYIGSLRPQTFGEDNEKGFIVIDEEFSEVRIKPDFKKYIKISLDLDDVNDTFIEKMKAKYANSIHNVRFVFSGTEEQLHRIDKRVYTKLGIDVKKNSKAVLKSIKSAEDKEAITFDKTSIIKNFLGFCKDNKIQSNKRALGLKYLKNL